MQMDLLGKPKQLYSCCNCPWEGFLPDGIEKVVGVTGCPRCGWAIWEIEQAREMGNIYSAFRKKYDKENKQRFDTEDGDVNEYE